MEHEMEARSSQAFYGMGLHELTWFIAFVLLVGKKDFSVSGFQGSGFGVLGSG